MHLCILVLAMLAPVATSGLLSYGICQTGCNLGAVACYAAAGLTFGTVTFGVGAPAPALACSATQGQCMAMCIVAGFVPTP